MRVAMLSVHGCPLARLGEKDAGGMNVYVRELSRALGQLGVGVDVYTRCVDQSTDPIVPLGSDARVIHIEAGGVRYVPKSGIYDLLPEFIGNLKSFAKTHDLHYDLVHGHYWLSGLVGLDLKSAWNVPLVQMFHTLGEVKNLVARRPNEMEGELRIDCERHIMAHADQLIAANADERAHMVWFYRADQDRIHEVPCGLDADLFRPLDRAACRARLGWQSDEQVVLFVGRIEPLKGIDILLRAVMYLVRCHDHPRLRAIIVGGDVSKDGDELQRLRALVQSLDLGAYVNFVGAQDQEVLPTYYTAADVCAMPSFHESFGMVAIEALSCGTPVVASRVGGLQYTIRDGETGFLVPRGDPVVLADRLCLLLSRPDLRDQMGQRAAGVAGIYDWQTIAQQILAVYQARPPDLRKTPF
ncbi:MAG: glycosyltransferase [Chloroflexi bacterium]|nr:glycosyltransferase [Chloroflexota bacterium]MBU1746061.1 glycosyltransferase [Chloroflexota bacterium]MBU1878776.1 glycosyltransferase [Chloroflexota bacterium]